MVFVELQHSLLDTDTWHFDTRVFASWTTVMGVCSRWREVAISSPELWEIVTSVSNTILVPVKKSDTGHHEVALPSSNRTLKVFLGPDGSNKDLMDAMRSEVSRIREIRFSVDDERTQSEINRLTEATATHLRTLVITDSRPWAFKMPSLMHKFSSLEVLCLSGYSMLQRVRFRNLRTLNIARTTFNLDVELESLAALMLASPRLNDASYQDVTTVMGTDDITTTGRLLGPNRCLRKFTFVNTAEVATFLTCFGIPPGATLAMRNVSGNILPDKASLLGDFADIEVADVHIGPEYLRITVSEGKSKLSAEWTQGLMVSMDTIAGLLRRVQALRIHMMDGGSSKGGDQGSLPSAEQIRGNVLRQAVQMGIDCEVVRG